MSGPMRPRGGLEPESMAYFKRVSAMLAENQFPGDEELQMFVDNVHNEVKGMEVVLATNTVGSRALEQLLHVAPPEVTVAVMDALAPRMVMLCDHMYASHVLEAFLTVVRHLDVHDESAPAAAMRAHVLALATAIAGAVGELVFGRYSSHIVRRLVHVLCGYGLAREHRKGAGGGDGVAGKKKRKRKRVAMAASARTLESDANQQLPVPPEYTDAFGALADALLEQCSDKTELAMLPHGSAVLQAFVQRLAPGSGVHAERYVALVSSLLSYEPADDLAALEVDAATVVDLCNDSNASHLVEKVVATAPKTLHGAVFRALLAHNETTENTFVRMALSPTGNFVLQALIRHRGASSRHVRAVLAALDAHWREIVSRRHAGVLHALAQSTVAPKLARALVRAVVRAWGDDGAAGGLVGAMGRAGPSALAVLTALCSLEGADAQALEPVFASLAGVGGDVAVELATSPAGSRMLEHVLGLATVRAETKAGVCRALLPHWAMLAAHKVGSRVVEAAFRAGDMAGKIAIVGSLSPHWDALRRDFVGKFVCASTRLREFVRDRAAWVKSEEEKGQRATFFDDIFGEDARQAAKKKQKRADAEDEAVEEKVEKVKKVKSKKGKKVVDKKRKKEKKRKKAAEKKRKKLKLKSKKKNKMKYEKK